MKYNPEDWEEIRLQFSRSMMVGIRLSSLAENLGVDWPVSGNDETPTKYINCSFEEVQELPTIKGKPERLELLIEILKETLAFDDPFGDMVEQIEKEVDASNDILKALQKLEIPEDYPISMTNISSETKAFCSSEAIETIGEFVRFCQHMAKNIVIGGDYRTFLNNLAHLDEKGIARFLPTRPGAKGLHLPEAIGLAVDQLSPSERLALYRCYGGKLKAEETDSIRQFDDATLRSLETRLQDDIAPAMDRFSADRDRMSAKLANGEPIDREFVHLNDNQKEAIAIGLFKAAVEHRGVKVKKAGFFKRLFGK